MSKRNRTVYIKCPKCKGSGLALYPADKGTCKICGGSGKIPVKN